MGIGPFSSDRDESFGDKFFRILGETFTRRSPVPDIPQVPPIPPRKNPDPKNFKVEYLSEIGNYLIVLINYPDCTNYEGNKILVYEGLSKEDFQELKTVDPHFSPSEVSPIARFEPTPRGLRLAKWLCWNVSRPGVGY